MWFPACGQFRVSVVCPNFKFLNLILGKGMSYVIWAKNSSRCESIVFMHMDTVSTHFLFANCMGVVSVAVVSMLAGPTSSEPEAELFEGENYAWFSQLHNCVYKLSRAVIKLGLASRGTS